MKTRLAVGLILLGLLIGCNSRGITGPDVNRGQTTPIVTQAPPPEATPTPGRCHPAGSCAD